MLITAPEELDSTRTNKVLFLAGGISNCYDWQSDAIDMISKSPTLDNLDIINPRRINWNVGDDEEDSIKQIQWEHKYIKRCDIIIFWFPHETLCPITLFELGAALQTKDKVFVGVDPNYKRKLDVIEQTRLVRPEINIKFSLEDLIKEIQE